MSLGWIFVSRQTVDVLVLSCMYRTTTLFSALSNTLKSPFSSGMYYFTGDTVAFDEKHFKETTEVSSGAT